ncbi:MAG: hypothetical protein HYX41_07140 [Bdellovibrio sp.]|nr:hypothetical protein [Bdellovibrio sp.]
MTDISWLSNQAHQVHGVFMSLFYALVTVLLALGVFVEYFKWPLGGMPSFSVLVGRALVAAILLHTYPQVSNTIADISDSLSKQLGDLNQFKLVLSSMGDHLKTLTFSWVSVRDAQTMIFSFVTFFLLYFSVHVVEAFLLYAWVMLYIFSPVLIALFVLPATAGATKAVYRTLLEMSCWKIVWSVLATLLWSTALSDINKPGHDINFLTSVCFNLILAGSVLLTPIVVHSLANSGLSGMAKTVGAITVGAATLSPGKVASSVGSALRRVKTVASAASEHVKGRYFSGSRKSFRPKSGAAFKAKTAKAPHVDKGKNLSANRPARYPDEILKAESSTGASKNQPKAQKRIPHRPRNPQKGISHEV